MPSDTPITGPANKWLPPLQPRPHARLRLFCFPYAGGSAAAYSGWPDYLSPAIDVRPLQLPGRWNRLKEPALTRFDDMLKALAVVLPPHLDRPFAFFGHSMGALLAFEMTRYLRRHGLPQPLHLFVSGRRAPQFPDHDLPRPDLPDPEFIECLRELNGTPAEVLDNPELMTLLLPTLRADFDVCRSYAFVPGPPLACPLTVLGGVEDKESAEGYLEGWRLHTSGRWAQSMFPGDHFFLHSAMAPLLGVLSTTMHDLLVRLSSSHHGAAARAERQP